jgi:hypothetical protein
VDNAHARGKTARLQIDGDGAPIKPHCFAATKIVTSPGAIADSVRDPRTANVVSSWRRFVLLFARSPGRLADASKVLAALKDSSGEQDVA